MTELCEVHCMLFNESALTLSDEILKETFKPEPMVIGMDHNTYEVTLYPDSKSPKCKDGWELV